MFPYLSSSCLERGIGVSQFALGLFGQQRCDGWGGLKHHMFFDIPVSFMTDLFDIRPVLKNSDAIFLNSGFLNSTKVILSLLA